MFSHSLDFTDMDEPTSGDVAWLIMASALIWLMLPGVGFFYSGLTGHKSALSLIMLSFIAMSVGTLQVGLAALQLIAVVFMGVFFDVFQDGE
jgi:ammonia channel protein AmtB